MDALKKVFSVIGKFFQIIWKIFIGALMIVTFPITIMNVIAEAAYLEKHPEAKSVTGRIRSFMD